MNSSAMNPLPIDDIMPSLDEQPSNQSDHKDNPNQRPRTQALRSKLTVWRYRGFKPKLPQVSFSWLQKTAPILKKYWWAALVILLIIAIAATWWGINYKQEQDWLKATDYYRRANYTKAAPILMELPLPQDADRLRIYGQTMQATNHPEQALEAYQNLYQQDKDPFAKLIIGNIYNQQQKYPEATKAYQEIISNNPTYVQAYVNLATVYRLQGKNSDAIQLTQKALQNNPNSVILAELFVSLTVDDPQSELHQQAVKKLKKLNPDDPLLNELESK